VVLEIEPRNVFGAPSLSAQPLTNPKSTVLRLVSEAPVKWTIANPGSNVVAAELAIPTPQTVLFIARPMTFTSSLR